MRKIYYQKRQKDLDDRIVLTTPGYYKGLRMFYITLLLLVAFVSAALFYSIGVSLLTAGISGGLFFFALLFLRFISRQSYVISIKDDTIIHTRADDRSFVTSVKSIGHLKSYKMIGFVVTRYQWNLDGMYKNSIIISKWQGNDNTPKTILKGVIRKYKKKANHKPGSVIAV